MICKLKLMYNYFQMYLKTLEINVLEHMNLIWLFFISTRTSMRNLFKKDNYKFRIINGY